MLLNRVMAEPIPAFSKDGHIKNDKPGSARWPTSLETCRRPTECGDQGTQRALSEQQRSNRGKDRQQPRTVPLLYLDQSKNFAERIGIPSCEEAANRRTRKGHRGETKIGGFLVYAR